ncbi:type II toxin-antitoxin system RelE/ParE family toxin [Bradyrhizobium sp.]|uniref:type II toxin-antitoxin system RelE/ParE family toxin n=1 Tax=Bradyrhizobium sp. TaxID=376 RepID=UPI003BB03946
MKVVVREAAAGDLDDILDWISGDNPRWGRIGSAHSRAHRSACDSRSLTSDGQVSSKATRELIEPPYIIVYMVDEPADEIAVLAIVHGARDREA